MVLSKPKWILVTPDRLPPGNDWVLWALTPEDYEAMARNTAEITRWTTQASQRLRYYREGLTRVIEQKDKGPVNDDGAPPVETQ